MMKHRISAMLSACCLAVSALAMPMNTSAVTLDPNKGMTEEEQELKEKIDIAINALNNERFKNGLNEMYTFPLLNELSCIRAEETEQVFGHSRPDGSSCFTLLKENNIPYGGTSENIAAGNASPVGTVEQWMNSPGHRANVLNETNTHIGVGYFFKQGSTYSYYWSMFAINSRESQTEIRKFEGQYIPERSFGDPDGSHEINASDAQIILYYAASLAAGMANEPPTGFKEAGDVNKDGNVDAIDASIILEYSAARGAQGDSVQITDFVW